MMFPNLSTPSRAIAGGAICLAILGGMIVGHAWPLWTGTTVLLRVRPVDPRDLFRGEFVRLGVPAGALLVSDDQAKTVPGKMTVRPLGRWQEYAKLEWRDTGRVRRSVVYVQLEPGAGGAGYQPVSISDTPVDNALNLRGRVRWIHEDGTVDVDYGLDAYYMQEGTARPVEDALRAGRLVQIEVAVASSGKSRIRSLLVDGVAVR